MFTRAHRMAAALAAVALISVTLLTLTVSPQPTIPRPAMLVASAEPSIATAPKVSRQPAPVIVPTTLAPAPAPAPAPPVVPPAPAPAPAPTVAPAPAPVAVAPTVAGQEATLIIPSIGLREPIVLGGQDTINRGVVAHYEGGGWRPPVPAGAPGTYWLAAHHATHGSPFASLPNIGVGATIVIDLVGGPEVRYQVTSLQVVGTTASNLTVYGPDTTTPRILLQTCEGGAYRLLVHGVRIG